MSQPLQQALGEVTGCYLVIGLSLCRSMDWSALGLSMASAVVGHLAAEGDAAAAWRNSESLFLCKPGKRESQPRRLVYPTARLKQSQAAQAHLHCLACQRARSVPELLWLPSHPQQSRLAHPLRSQGLRRDAASLRQSRHSEVSKNL